MGFFSWMTQDTDRSIANRWSGRETFPVYMIDDKGNVWHEPYYDGYGVFGGKDYYELLAEMNGLGPYRMLGLELAFSKTPKVKHPNLVEDATNWTYNPEGPESCELQGFFYGRDSDEDDHEDEWGDYGEEG